MSGILPQPGFAARQFAFARRQYPFMFWHEDTILVPIAVAATGTLAIVDSAAAVSMIDRSFAGAADVLVTSAGQSLAGPGGRFQASRTAPFQVSVADVVATLPWAAAIDLSEVSRAMGRPVGFLLGQDILREYLLDFRFDTKQFTVHPNGTVFDRSGMVELSLGRRARQEPTIEIAMEGEAPVSAAVDTGNSSPLLLSAAYADEAGLSSRRTSTALSATANGLSTNRLITLRTLRMENIELHDVPTEIYSAWTSNGSPANIGMPLLAAARLVFDFGHDRLWRGRSATGPLRRDRSGLGLAVRPDRLLVMHVAAGSAAESDGWNVKDEITAIDGKPVDRTYNSGNLWRWRFRPAGSLIELKLSDRTVRHLRLADYY